MIFTLAWRINSDLLDRHAQRLRLLVNIEHRTCKVVLPKLLISSLENMIESFLFRIRVSTNRIVSARNHLIATEMTLSEVFSLFSACVWNDVHTLTFINASAGLRTGGEFSRFHSAKKTVDVSSFTFKEHRRWTKLTEAKDQNEIREREENSKAKFDSAPGLISLNQARRCFASNCFSANGTHCQSTLRQEGLFFMSFYWLDASWARECQFSRTVTNLLVISLVCVRVYFSLDQFTNHL